MSYSEKPTISKQIEENNKIIIEITGANEPPKVTIGGQEVAVKGLEYYFETDTDTPGINEFLVTYHQDGRRQFDKIGFEK